MYKQIYPTYGIWDGTWQLIKKTDPIPDGYTDIQPFSPCYKLKFVDGAWVETATQEYIGKVTPDNTPKPTPEQQMLANVMLKMSEWEAKQSE